MEPHQSRILVMEDDENLLNLFRRVLLKMSFNVDAVSTAIEARQLILDNRYDVFLCDMIVQGERGIDIVRDMEPYLSRARTTVVAVTGREEMRSADEFDFFVSKPVSTHDLVTLVSRLIASKANV
jgi:CheY-like chemotaxis protein